MDREVITMKFGEILSWLIEDGDITQKDLAASLNIAPSTMSGYVTGNREPDFATLKLIAYYFDVSIDYLLDPVSYTHLSPPTYTLRTAKSSFSRQTACGVF